MDFRYVRVLLQNDMVEEFRNDPTAFRCVVHHHGTVMSMGYFKDVDVVVSKRGFNILEDVSDP